MICISRNLYWSYLDSNWGFFLLGIWGCLSFPPSFLLEIVKSFCRKLWLELKFGQPGTSLTVVGCNSYTRYEFVHTFSLQVYWMRLFILPKKITDQVDQLLRSFLWNGTDKKLTGAKVAWADINCLKSEGGLGIKKTEVWNKACMGKADLESLSD